MMIRRLTAPVWSFIAVCLTALPLFAAEAQPGPPGPQGPPGPAGTSTTMFLGLDQNTALIVGGLVLAVIVILAIVSMTNKSKTA